MSFDGIIERIIISTKTQEYHSIWLTMNFVYWAIELQLTNDSRKHSKQKIKINNIGFNISLDFPSKTCFDLSFSVVASTFGMIWCFGIYFSQTSNNITHVWQ